MSINMMKINYLIILNCVTLMYAQVTIKDIILTRPELSKISVHLQKLYLLTFFGIKQTKPITFFAPHNDAFMYMSDNMLNQLSRMSSEMAHNIYSYHTVYKQWKTADLASGNQIRLNVFELPTSIFISKINQSAYVNGALIIIPDLVASNGFVHIIDRMLVDMSLNGPTTNSFASDAYLFACQDYSLTVDKRLSTREFCSLLNLQRKYESSESATSQYGHVISDILAYSNFESNSNSFSTFFITNDDFIQKFAQKYQDKFNELINLNTNLLRTVIESQVVPIKGYHSRLFSDLSLNNAIPAVQGEARMYAFNNMLSVSNKCKRANIVQANITVLNSVIYIIDDFLGFISNDLYQEIDADSNLMSFQRNLNRMPSSFLDSLKIPAGANSGQISEYTIFAALGDVFDRVSLSDSTSMLIQQMNMQFLKGSFSLMNLINGSIYPTLRSGYNLKIIQHNSDYFVEVDYVRAKIVDANICTKNGLIHKIDRILGVPDRTILKTLQKTNSFSRLVGYVANVGYLTMLDDQQRMVTFFAANDSAFSSAQNIPLFQQQNNKKLRNVFNRHVSNSILFLDTIPVNSAVNLRTNNGDISIRNTNNDLYVIIGSKSIRVLQANLRMINGVMHVVDQLLFDPNDPATWESSVDRSQRVRTCIALQFIVALIYLLSF